MTSDAIIPEMPRGVRLHECPVRGAWFLLAPERALRLDAIGHAILCRVDGTRSLGAIVVELAEVYGAPADRVAQDVERFLGDLADRCILELR